MSLTKTAGQHGQKRQRFNDTDVPFLLISLVQNNNGVKLNTTQPSELCLKTTTVIAIVYFIGSSSLTNVCCERVIIAGFSTGTTVSTLWPVWFGRATFPSNCVGDVYLWRPLRTRTKLESSWSLTKQRKPKVPA